MVANGDYKGQDVFEISRVVPITGESERPELGQRRVSVHKNSVSDCEYTKKPALKCRPLRKKNFYYRPAR